MTRTVISQEDHSQSSNTPPVAPPLSKHRHISFTAHYTGYIWYQMGISHPALATTKGKTLAALVHPIESWAEKYCI